MRSAFWSESATNDRRRKPAPKPRKNWTRKSTDNGWKTLLVVGERAKLNGKRKRRMLTVNVSPPKQPELKPSLLIPWSFKISLWLRRMVRRSKKVP